MESYTEGSYPRKALFGGIAFPTKVTLGSFLPSVLCVVKLPNSYNLLLFFKSRLPILRLVIFSKKQINLHKQQLLKKVFLSTFYLYFFLKP